MVADVVVNQIDFKARAIGADRVIVAMPGFNHKRVRTRRGSDGINNSSCVFDPVVTAPGSDTIISAKYLAADKTVSQSMEVRCQVVESFRRPGRDAVSRD